MISFINDGRQFNYRIVGIALHDDHVLLQRAEHDTFWALPGGRGELLESSPDTLCREIAEELGETVAVERLIWVVENFFEYNQLAYHELALYYLIRFPAQSPLYRLDPVTGLEDGNPLYFRWFPLLAVEQLEVYPSFLRQGLRALPAQITHLIHYDE